MTLTLQPIRVATGFDEEGTLVLDEEQRLVARTRTRSPLGSGTWRQALGGWMGSIIPPLLIWTQPRSGFVSASPLEPDQG
jgi:hypothetical protein